MRFYLQKNLLQSQQISLIIDLDLIIFANLIFYINSAQKRNVKLSKKAKSSLFSHLLSFGHIRKAQAIPVWATTSPCRWSSNPHVSHTQLILSDELILEAVPEAVEGFGMLAAKDAHEG